MKPLIKWPGGKSQEFKKFQEFIPHDFVRYFEPFLGGGGVFFKLLPKRSYLNDIDQKLISFYEAVQERNKEFKQDLLNINHDWHDIERCTSVLKDFYMQYLHRNTDELPSKLVLKDLVDKVLEKKSSELRQKLKLEFGDVNTFFPYLSKFFKSKVTRIQGLQIKHETKFDRSLHLDHLLTAIKSGYYTYLRDEYFNSDKNNPAVFFFIREFCYGSMFRYNKKGNFNIPYGGINYNQKDFLGKIEHLFSEIVQEKLQQVTFYNADFEEFLSNFDLNTEDFIFLDPPYDSDFKDYGKNPFTQQDQKRLANLLENCNAKWMLVIQDTDLIRKLYFPLEKENNNFKILSYDKSYTYNVRGRNERETSHFLIMNYKPTNQLEKYFTTE